MNKAKNSYNFVYITDSITVTEKKREKSPSSEICEEVSYCYNAVLQVGKNEKD